jgi:hypothetical protein
MKIRNVTKDWDWTFGQSTTNYVKDENAIILDIQMKIKEWYQDCFFALQNGIPWGVRLGFHNQKEALDNDVITTAESVEGVLDVTNFSSYVENRQYHCQFDVYTQYSTQYRTVTFQSGGA